MIRIGTRTSRLARAQARQVAQGLEAEGHETELVPTDTLGDQVGKAPVHELGVAGAFTSGLETALVREEVDLAVHSLKDLPTETPEPLTVAAVLERGPPGDVLLARPGVHEPDRALPLAEGARVATSGPRRQSQLLAARDDVVVANVRGNVDTRVGKLREGRFDALVTAHVVLDRMDLDLKDLAVHPLDPERFPPAPGQAAIAVQAREDSPAERQARGLDDEATRAAVEAERDLLAQLGGGCGLAFGAWARPTDTGWTLDATFAGHGWDTTCRATLHRERRTGPDLEALLEPAGQTLADTEPQPRRPRLEEVPDPEGAPVLVVASEPTARDWAALLRERGQPAHPLATKRFSSTGAPTKEERARLQQADWIALTSRQAAAPLAEAAGDRLDAYLAAVGPATARALQGQGLPCHVVAPEATGASLAEELARLARGQRVLLVQGDVVHGEARRGLEEAGVELDVWQAYETEPIAVDLEDLDIELPAPAALVMSPENARSIPGQTPEDLADVAEVFVALGPSTAAALRERGLEPVVAEAPRPDAVLDVIP